MSNIELKGVAKSFGETTVIPGLDLTVDSQEFMVFVGPSGCGKSTMLRLIAGLESVSGGEVWIDGERVNDKAASDRGVAMVFQSYALYPHMTVARNMGFGLRMSGMKATEVKKQVEQVAETLKLSDLLDRYPKELSGGQRQRVAIGRAIVRRPKVFLFDEPLSNLDAKLRVQMRIELARLHKELKTTMIYVTHDQTEAMTLGNRIAVFNKGIIEQVGAPLELYQKPHNAFVAEFLGSPKINILPYQWDAGASEIMIGKLKIAPKEFGVTDKLLAKGSTLAVRPEHLKISDDKSGLEVEIEFIETLGDVCIVYAHLKGTDLQVIVKAEANQSGLNQATSHYISIDAGSTLVFDNQNKLI